MSQILPQLYLGDQQATKTIQDVNVIISIGCKHKSLLRTIEIYKFSIADSSTSDLTEIFDQCCPLMHEKIERNLRVLVHCKGGINRSPMVVMAYLCKYCNYSVEEAVIHVTTNRKSTRVQSHYLNQLIHWLAASGS
jgi:protein-tyrosine phosphatase